MKEKETNIHLSKQKILLSKEKQELIKKEAREYFLLKCPYITAISFEKYFNIFYPFIIKQIENTIHEERCTIIYAVMLGTEAEKIKLLNDTSEYIKEWEENKKQIT